MFGEKVKVNTVFIRDSTGVSDSVLILFGGALIKGDTVIFFLCHSSILSVYCPGMLIFRGKLHCGL